MLRVTEMFVAFHLLSYPHIVPSLSAGLSEGPSLSFLHLLPWDAGTPRHSAAPYFNSAVKCRYLPVCPLIDPHFSDQWPSECRRPLPDPAELHLRPVHQVGVPANQNAERWPHDSDTPWPQRYRPHCDKTGEAKTALLFFSFLFFISPPTSLSLFFSFSLLCHNIYLGICLCTS